MVTAGERVPPPSLFGRREWNSHARHPVLLEKAASTPTAERLRRNPALPSALFQSTFLPVSERARNYAKPFAIGGFVVAEIIMVLVMLAPNLKGAPRPPVDHLLIRLLVGAFFFGPFGLAAGTGLGLLFNGSRTLFLRHRRSAIVGLIVGEVLLFVTASALVMHSPVWQKDTSIANLILYAVLFGIWGIAGGILMGALLARSRSHTQRRTPEPGADNACPGP
jgi:hypothetical protein